MKKLFILMLGCAISQLIFAQGNVINYQSVLRDGNGYVMANEPTQMRIRLTDPEGDIVYEETHLCTTDRLGQIQLPVGAGQPSSGYDVTGIDWSEELTLVAEDLTHGSTATMPVSSVPRSMYATTAAGIQGLSFDDNSEPSSTNYYSSDKVQRLIQGQGGQTSQTALAKEIAERKSEDLRILDSIKMEADRRILADLALLDSIAKVAAANKEDYGYLLDSIAKERASRILEDNRLWDSVRTLTTRIVQVDLERKAEDNRIWDSITSIRQDLNDAEQNVCIASDPSRGIYTSAIPLYDVDNPDTIGLFTMPELKVLKQSGSCQLFSSLNLAGNLDRAYKTRIMTYNMTGSLMTPQTITIPAGESGIDVYVDNYLIDAPVEYKTYDILVFDVEYYHIGDGEGKLYVTLVRE